MRIRNLPALCFVIAASLGGVNARAASQLFNGKGGGGWGREVLDEAGFHEFHAGNRGVGAGEFCQSGVEVAVPGDVRIERGL